MLGTAATPINMPGRLLDEDSVSSTREASLGIGASLVRRINRFHARPARPRLLSLSFSTVARELSDSPAHAAVEGSPRPGTLISRELNHEVRHSLLHQEWWTNRFVGSETAARAEAEYTEFVSLYRLSAVRRRLAFHGLVYLLVLLEPGAVYEPLYLLLR